MRTIFVNPSLRKRKRKSAPKRKRKNPGTSLVGARSSMATLANPTRRRRRKASKRRNPKSRRRARRRNGLQLTGITPFVRSNPRMILNPRRRRARRRNPALLGLKLPSMGGMQKTIISAGMGSALGVLLNGYALNKIAHPWMRNGARVAAAIGSGMVLRRRPEMAAAAAGAVLYPTMQELAARYLPAASGFVAATPALVTSADLDVLSADLDAAFGDYQDSTDPIF